ncbi:MAG: DUF4339 domain-containing protein [Bdellovibrionaceae bacterium]|nr:DUF4339 domain-containing protein [Pseudobdellovibrionaceae bacterium]
MSQAYHVARGDTCVGQFSKQEILARVERRELDPFDHVFDEAKHDWIAIIVHPAFASETDFWTKFQHQNIAKPRNMNVGFTPEASAPAADAAGEKEAWFVLKGDHRFGPFEYLELIRLLQEKSIGDWDFVWSKRHTKWVRLSMLPEFQPDHIKGLRETLSEKLGRSINEVFFRRRFARASFDGSILIHDNKKLYRGRSMEMGAGGLSVQLAAEEAVLKVGDHVHLHVKPSAETPAFNSACEVMSVRSLSTGDANSPVVFGMKFIGLEDNVRTELDGWATRKKNGAAA